MEGDGMLLNFDFGEAPLVSQVKYKGGKWRDRRQAQRSAQKEREGPTAENKEQPEDARTDAVSNSGPGSRKHHGEQEFEEPPAKRQRPDGPKPNPYRTGKLPAGSITISRPGGVTSRLFTSNPEPKTTFDDEEQPQEDIAPSNAPIDTASFASLGISRRLNDFLSSKLELTTPTAIQSKVIPHLLGREDQDAFIKAQTGSGKTLAYLLPILQQIMSITVSNGTRDADGTDSSPEKRIHRDSGIFAVILAPTRELAKQIDTVLSKLLQCAPWVVCTTVTGGERKKSEKGRIRKGANILIGTPGRLSDHLNNTKVLDEQLGTVRWVVLDEGDRLMEMGFEEDLKNIIGKIRKSELRTKSRDGVTLDTLPKRRVTVLCSATLKSNVQKLGEISLEDAVYLTGGSDDQEDVTDKDAFQAPAQLKQSFTVVPAKTRLVTLIALLKSAFARRGSVMKAILFISCADSVNFHFNLLKSPKKGAKGQDGPSSADNISQAVDTVAAAAYITSQACPIVQVCRLHGSLPQPVRTSTLAAFKASKDPAVLITTDISSRGLDVPEVDLVIEYDPAFSVADHVHRIGRTARAGRIGRTVLFLLPGTEEGYIGIMPPTPIPSPQSYESVLQKGLEIPLEFPIETDAKPASEKSYKGKAEALQLHLEQRLLTDKILLDAARTGFRSHIKAYATHVKDERSFFDITELHLGHVAKSFGLREPPAGIGLGVHSGKRKIAVKHSSKGAPNAASAKRDAVEQDAVEMAKRMKQKMGLIMNAASEFNIG
jgi:ATP-dependent RNA helicase DDX31/DBP7